MKKEEVEQGEVEAFSICNGVQREWGRILWVFH